MTYHKAFITLLGAAGAALEELGKLGIANITPEIFKAAELLQEAVYKTETTAAHKSAIMQITVPKRLHLCRNAGDWHGRLHKRL